MRLRKFLIVVVELFFILLFYKFLKSSTGLTIGPYLLVALLLIFVLNYYLAKWELMGEIGRTILYKIFSRTAFTGGWFGILTMFFVVIGFFISQVLFQSAFMVYLIVIVGIVFAFYLFRSGRPNSDTHALLLIGFLVGIGIGGKYANNLFIILVFVLANIFLYFTSYPGEREKGLS